jgi:hypothetical protein
MTDADRDPAAAQPPRVDPTAAFAAPEPGPGGPAPTVAPLANVIARPTKQSSRGGTILMGLAAAIAVGGIAFAAGRLTAPATASTGTFGNRGGQFVTSGQGPGDAQGQGGQGFQGRLDGAGGFGGSLTVRGTVSAVTADSITVKLASGNEITIPLDGSTAYHTTAPATSAAVTVGSTVAVTPGARTVSPNASFAPNASPGPGGFGAISFGAATDVTVTGQ